MMHTMVLSYDYYIIRTRYAVIRKSDRHTFNRSQTYDKSDGHPNTNRYISGLSYDNIQSIRCYFRGLCSYMQYHTTDRMIAYEINHPYEVNFSVRTCIVILQNV